MGGQGALIYIRSSLQRIAEVLPYDAISTGSHRAKKPVWSVPHQNWKKVRFALVPPMYSALGMSW